MTTKILIGLDGHSSGERALAYAQKMAKVMGDCELHVAYVIEWSPFSFQTAEENATRHKRREEEIETAQTRIIAPALAKLADAGFTASGFVRHGNVADVLDALAVENGADMIVVGRIAESGFGARIFGSATANLVMQASVPVTVVN
jgi:nucleotide-binding universal stress UspA family protein